MPTYLQSSDFRLRYINYSVTVKFYAKVIENIQKNREQNSPTSKLLTPRTPQQSTGARSFYHSFYTPFRPMTYCLFSNVTGSRTANLQPLLTHWFTAIPYGILPVYSPNPIPLLKGPHPTSSSDPPHLSCSRATYFQLVDSPIFFPR